ncbi:MAG TPA: sugar transferase [Spirochaetaceae bacterium]|nr:sugar transferase [Spirochaetaceae bacterium]
MTERKRRQFLIALIDAVLLYVALYLALTFRSGRIPSKAEWLAHLWPFAIVNAGWILCFYTAGLYGFEIIFNWDLLIRRLVASASIATLGSAALFYVYKSPGISPKTVLLIFAIFATVLIFLSRAAFARVTTTVLKKRGVAYMGNYRQSIQEIIDSADILERMGYESRLIVDNGSFPADVAKGIRRVTDAEALSEAVRSGDIDLIVIADEKALAPEIRSLLFSLLEDGAKFLNLYDFYEILFRRTPLDGIDETWFLEKIDLSSKKPYMAAKRIIDIALAMIVLLITAAFWPFVALAIKLSSYGPVFFTQLRLGRLGVPIRIIKFRTMRIDGNDQRPTGEKDTRITSIGIFLRKTRIDEIPQMFNVLRGDMSFVGPRPERPELAEELARRIPYYRQRLFVKPGLTGWDQVSGEYHSPSDEDTFKKLQADLYYVKNLSLSLDASIFFKTILTVLKGGGR